MLRAMRGLLAVAGATALMACGKTSPVGFSEETKWVLAAPERFEMAALDPEAAVGADDVSLHGVKVLWRGAVTDAATRRLAEALYADVVPNPTPSGCVFVPHHAVIASRGDKTIEMLICFRCGDVETWSGGKREYVQIQGTPQIFDAALRAAGMPAAATASAAATR